MVDCSAGVGGTVFSPIHREHKRVWHGDYATVGNVPRKARSFTGALDVYARAGSFLGPVVSLLSVWYNPAQALRAGEAREDDRAD